MVKLKGWIIIIIISTILLNGEDKEESDFIYFLNNIKNMLQQLKEKEEKNKKRTKQKKERARKMLIKKLSTPPAVVKKVVIDVKPPSNALGQNLPKNYSNKSATNIKYSNNNAVPFLKKENPSTIPIFTKTLKKLSTNIDKIYKNLQGAQKMESAENVSAQFFAELSHYHIMLMKEILKLPETVHKIFNEFPSFYTIMAIKCNYFLRFVEKYPHSEKNFVISLLQTKDITSYTGIYSLLGNYRDIINIKDNDTSGEIKSITKRSNLCNDIKQLEAAFKKSFSLFKDAFEIGKKRTFLAADIYYVKLKNLYYTFIKKWVQKVEIFLFKFFSELIEDNFRIKSQKTSVLIELLYRYLLRPELQNKGKELCRISGILNNPAMMPSWLECTGCNKELKSIFESSPLGGQLKKALENIKNAIEKGRTTPPEVVNAIEKWKTLSSNCINHTSLVDIMDGALNDIINALSPEEIIDNIFSPLKELDRIEIEVSRYLISSNNKCAPLLLTFIAVELNYPILIDAVFDRGIEGILYLLDRRPSLRMDLFDQSIFLQIMDGIYETQTEVILDLEKWLRWITIADYYFYIYHSYADALLCWKNDFPKLKEGMCKVDLRIDDFLLNSLMGDTMNCFLGEEKSLFCNSHLNKDFIKDILFPLLTYNNTDPTLQNFNNNKVIYNFFTNFKNYTSIAQTKKLCTILEFLDKEKFPLEFFVNPSGQMTFTFGTSLDRFCKVYWLGNIDRVASRDGRRVLEAVPLFSAAGLDTAEKIQNYIKNITCPVVSSPCSIPTCQTNPQGRRLLQMGYDPQTHFMSSSSSCCTCRVSGSTFTRDKVCESVGDFLASLFYNATTCRDNKNNIIEGCTPVKPSNYCNWLLEVALGKICPFICELNGENCKTLDLDEAVKELMDNTAYLISMLNFVVIGGEKFTYKNKCVENMASTLRSFRTKWEEEFAKLYGKHNLEKIKQKITNSSRYRYRCKN